MGGVQCLWPGTATGCSHIYNPLTPLPRKKFQGASFICSVPPVPPAEKAKHRAHFKEKCLKGFSCLSWSIYCRVHLELRGNKLTTDISMPFIIYNDGLCGRVPYHPMSLHNINADTTVCVSHYPFQME